MGEFLSVEKSTQDEIKSTIKGLSEIASVRLAAWTRYALTEEANEYAEYVKETKLSGNAATKGKAKIPIRKITGELYNSTRAWTSRAKGKNKTRTIYVRPGVNVRGSLNYLVKWCGTPLEFMRPAFREFSRGDRIKKAVGENINKMLDKTAKEMSE